MSVKKQAIKKILHTSDEAFDLFRRQLEVDVTNLNPEVARSQFDDLMEQYALKPTTKTIDLGDGLKRKITDDTAAKYDYDKFIDEIGNNSGYQNLSRQNASRYADLEFSSNNTFVEDYNARQREWVKQQNKKKNWQKKKLESISSEDARDLNTAQEIENTVGDTRNMSREEYYNQRQAIRQSRSEGYKAYQDKIDRWNTPVDIVDPSTVEPRKVNGLTIEERLGKKGYRTLNGQSFDERLNNLKLKKLESVNKEAEEKFLKGKNYEDLNKKTKKAYTNFVKKQEQKVKNMFGDIDSISNPNGKINVDYDKAAAQDVLDNATGKDGIHLWQKIKDHPRISTAIAIGTVWGVSELTEDDSL